MDQIVKRIKWYHIMITLLLIFGIVFYIIHINKDQTTTSVSTNETFSNESRDNIILYYAEWCGFSKLFAPEWEKFEEYAKTNLPNLKVTKIRCEGDMESECMNKNIKGFPSVILEKSDGQEIPFVVNKPEERNVENLIKFIKSN